MLRESSSWRESLNRAQLWREDAERYRVLMREISKEEKERIIGSLTDKGERVLRPGGAGGAQGCGDAARFQRRRSERPICGKSGLTKRGLALHMVRLHKSETEKAAEKEAA
jgi:hypothetical protein